MLASKLLKKLSIKIGKKKMYDQDEQINKEFLYLCDLKECGKYLDNPIALPCGHSICKKHILPDDKTFQCNSCNRAHMVPQDENNNGFQINFKLANMLKLNMHLTGKHKQVKEQYDKISNEIIQFETSQQLSSPDSYLSDYFSDLRNQVNVHLEQMIADLVKKTTEIVKKLNDYENECKMNQEKIVKFNLNNLRKKEWHELLNDPNLTEEKLKELEKEINQIPNELENKIRTYKNELMMNRNICFQAYDEKLKFGYLEIRSHKLVSYYNGHYEGEFLNEKKHGQGTFSWSNGNKYVGEWREDKRTGKGVIHFAETGDRYEGEFLNGEFHGAGIYYHKNGEKREGIWKHGAKI